MRSRGYPGLPGGPNVITRVLSCKGRQEDENQRSGGDAGERGGEGSGEGEVDLKMVHGWLCACPESRFLSSRPGVCEAKGRAEDLTLRALGPTSPACLLLLSAWQPLSLVFYIMFSSELYLVGGTEKGTLSVFLEVTAAFLRLTGR